MRESEPPETEEPEPPPLDDEHAPPLQLLDGGGQGGEAFEQLPYLTTSLGSACSLLRRRDIREMVLGSGQLEVNEMTAEIEFNRTPVTDALMLRFRELVEAKVRGTDETGAMTKAGKPKSKIIRFGAETTKDAFLCVASERQYHPIREYLEGLEPPGEPYAIGRAADVLGFGETSIERDLLHRWAVGCVARIIKPGCQLDTVLILVSAGQGRKKSSFFRALASDQWFSDTDMDLESKDSRMQLRQAWIYEWGELASLRRRDVEMVKGFISSREDVFRPPYGSAVRRYPRHTVIVGSTNSGAFLSDPSGNRRFWPVRVGKINLRAIEGIRDAFWSEAVSLYRGGQSWWLDDEEALAVLHADVEVHDEWEAPVSEWLETAAHPVTVRRALLEGLKLREQDVTRANEMRVAELCHRLGWQRGARERIGHAWFRPWFQHTPPVGTQVG